MANKDTHLIFDIETIGNDTLKCPMLDISYTTFRWSRFSSDSPYTFKELIDSVHTIKLQIQDQVENYGCSFKNSDLDFWRKQGPEAVSKIKPSKHDVTVDQMVRQFTGYLIENPEIHHWWSRGNVFDVTVLERLIKQTDKKYMYLFKEYLKFWRVRDTRSWIDAKLDFPDINGFIPLNDEEYWKSVFNGHISSHDIAADILRLQTIHRLENDLSHPER